MYTKTGIVADAEGIIRRMVDQLSHRLPMFKTSDVLKYPRQMASQQKKKTDLNRENHRLEIYWKLYCSHLDFRCFKLQMSFNIQAFLRSRRRKKLNYTRKIIARSSVEYI
jgi:hypothetical protein